MGSSATEILLAIILAVIFPPILIVYAIFIGVAVYEFTRK